ENLPSQISTLAPASVFCPDENCISSGVRSQPRVFAFACPSGRRDRLRMLQRGRVQQGKIDLLLSLPCAQYSGCGIDEIHAAHRTCPDVPRMKHRATECLALVLRSEQIDIAVHSLPSRTIQNGHPAFTVCKYAHATTSAGAGRRIGNGRLASKGFPSITRNGQPNSAAGFTLGPSWLRACQATYTLPARSAAIEPPPSKPNVCCIRLRSGSNAVPPALRREYSIGVPLYGLSAACSGFSGPLGFAFVDP